jgi:hypothetical protein
MLHAFVKSGDLDEKKKQELASQLAMTKAKEQLLAKAKNRYSQIYVASGQDTEEILVNGIFYLEIR